VAVGLVPGTLAALVRSDMHEEDADRGTTGGPGRAYFGAIPAVLVIAGDGEPSATDLRCALRLAKTYLACC
jgi:hypothetical protein